jgi:hypothetical protein
MYHFFLVDQFEYAGLRSSNDVLVYKIFYIIVCVSFGLNQSMPANSQATEYAGIWFPQWRRRSC